MAELSKSETATRPQEAARRAKSLTSDKNICSPRVLSSITPGAGWSAQRAVASLGKLTCTTIARLKEGRFGGRRKS